MNRFLVLVVALILVLGLAGFIFWRLHRAPDQGTDSRGAPPPAVEEQVTPPEPPPPPRSLPITGRVLLTAAEPAVDVAVVLGDEKVMVDGDGAFNLAPSLRPRTLPLRVVRGEEVLCAWDAVITGDLVPPGEPPPEAAPDPPAVAPAGDGKVGAAEGGEGVEGEAAPPPAPSAAGEEALEASLLAREMEPARPGFYRWTITLAPSTVGSPAGGALPEGVWIRGRHALVEEWGVSARIRLSGTSRLPEGAHVAMSLYFDEERTLAAQRAARIAAGAFESTAYVPQDLQFYSGVYEVSLSFNPVLETFEALEAWQKTHPGVRWEELGFLEVRHRIFMGSLSESREQDRVASSYYVKALDEARALDRALKGSLITERNQRRVFQEGKPVLKKSSGGEVEWFARGYLDSTGKLDQVVWRKFLDNEWRPRLLALLDAHRKRGQEKYPRASALLSNLLDALLEESYGYSKFVVYPAFGLAAHPNDDYADEERGADLVRLEKIVQGCFEGLERFRTLGQ